MLILSFRSAFGWYLVGPTMHQCEGWGSMFLKTVPHGPTKECKMLPANIAADWVCRMHLLIFCQPPCACVSCSQPALGQAACMAVARARMTVVLLSAASKHFEQCQQRHYRERLFSNGFVVKPNHALPAEWISVLQMNSSPYRLDSVYDLVHHFLNQPGVVIELEVCGICKRVEALTAASCVRHQTLQEP